MLPLILLIGCQQRHIDYALPVSQEMQQVVVNATIPETHSVVIQSEIHSADKIQQLEDWRRQHEAADKYDAYSTAWNSDDLTSVEADLERYCNSLFSNSCLENLKEYCGRDGCRDVTVECDNFRDTDDVCTKYDIGVSSDLIETQN
jgi:hypothetical protein